MGTQNFYYLMADHPEEMDGLIRTIHEREIEAFRILAEGPWEAVTLVENTSTYYIGPQIYKDYNMPHQREFVEIVKRAAKTAILHSPYREVPTGTRLHIPQLRVPTGTRLHIPQLRVDSG